MIVFDIKRLSARARAPGVTSDSTPRTYHTTQSYHQRTMTKKLNKPEWFTIKDAAAYLEIGEPTIYRWMRDCRMTYRKVGDSTRFLQEDLDALVEIFLVKRTPGASRNIAHRAITTNSSMAEFRAQAASASGRRKPYSGRIVQAISIPLPGCVAAAV